MLPPKIPTLGTLEQIDCVSASQAHHLLKCPLSFALSRSTRLRDHRAFVASAVLGTAAHAALAALIRAREMEQQDASDATRSVAKCVFDESLKVECARRDATVAGRGRIPGDNTDPPSRLPYYALMRARLARFAEQRFGPDWRWPRPRLRRDASPAAANRPARPERSSAEVKMVSRDGAIVGVADAIQECSGFVVVEEFKTGEPSPARMVAWKQQLLLYAYLYREVHGQLPALLRLYSLSAGTFEFEVTEREVDDVGEQTTRALRSMNRAVASGGGPEELARPSGTACVRCPHRAWCEPYWIAGAPGAGGADATGIVAKTDGWVCELEPSTGSSMHVDFSALRVTLNEGVAVRLCDALLLPDGTLRCTRSTSVWSVA